MRGSNCRNNEEKSAENMSDERMDTCTRFEIIEEQNIEFNPKYSSEELKKTLKEFIRSSRCKDVEYLRETSASIHEGILGYGSNEKTFNVNILEHSHYIYSSLQRQFFNDQEELEAIDKRKIQFNETEYPSEEHYNLLIDSLNLISELMCRWHIFDINDYGYRYKGRSLSVEIVDIGEINKKCVAPDIVWFTFAITHAPFKQRIEKALMLYGKILQHALNQVFDFFKINDLSSESFNLTSSLFFCRRRQTRCDQLYRKLKSLEVSYRYFEKHLLEEFLKIV